MQKHNNTKELYNLKVDPSEDNNLSGTGIEIEEILTKSLNKIKQKI